MGIFQHQGGLGGEHLEGVQALRLQGPPGSLVVHQNHPGGPVFHHQGHDKKFLGRVLAF